MSFPFLNLPRELRDQIYIEYLRLHMTPIRMELVHCQRTSRQGPYRLNFIPCDKCARRSSNNTANTAETFSIGIPSVGLEGSRPKFHFVRPGLDERAKGPLLITSKQVSTEYREVLASPINAEVKFIFHWARKPLQALWPEFAGWPKEQGISHIRRLKIFIEQGSKTALRTTWTWDGLRRLWSFIPRDHRLRELEIEFRNTSSERASTDIAWELKETTTEGFAGHNSVVSTLRDILKSSSSLRSIQFSWVDWRTQWTDGYDNGYRFEKHSDAIRAFYMEKQIPTQSTPLLDSPWVLLEEPSQLAESELV